MLHGACLSQSQTLSTSPLETEMESILTTGLGLKLLALGWRSAALTTEVLKIQGMSPAKGSTCVVLLQVSCLPVLLFV